MNNINNIIEYIDDIFFKNKKDINGIKNSIEMLCELYKNNNLANDEVVFLVKSVYEKIKTENQEIDDDFLALMIGTHIGLILGKYSKKINFESVEV